MPYPEIVAPPEWRCIDFISDLHLSEDTPGNFDVWSAYLHDTPADAVFILGDLFEAWVGDDARHGGFEARCAAVLEDAAARRHVAFMVGNRDFMVGSDMTDACGIDLLHDPTVLVAFGQRALLTHGDELCIDDIAYQRVRSTVRQSEWKRQAMLRPLDERRAMARAMRSESERQHLLRQDEPWFDIDRDTTLAWMRSGGTPTLIHGHTHRPASEPLAPGFVRHVLSDWDVDDARAPRAEVLRWSDGTLSRVALRADKPSAA